MLIPEKGKPYTHHNGSTAARFMAIKLFSIKLTKEQLDAIPEAERNLLILSAHAANELAVLTKLFHLCSRHEAASELAIQARNAQAMTLGRLLTGKLYECWNLLQSAFFGTKLSKAYECQFDEGAAAALTSLKKYFGAKNLIATVRNQHAFHYSPDQIAKGYAMLPAEEPLSLYLSDTNTNTLYAFADVIAGYALIEDIHPESVPKALDALIVETSKVIGWLNQVIAACMTIAISNYVADNLEGLGSHEVEVTGAPNWKAISIPYFVEIPDTEVT